jgi:hypothetical protein
MRERILLEWSDILATRTCMKLDAVIRLTLITWDNMGKLRPFENMMLTLQTLGLGA